MSDALQTAIITVKVRSVLKKTVMGTHLNVTFKLAKTGQLGKGVDDNACEVHLHRVVLKLLVHLTIAIITLTLMLMLLLMLKLNADAYHGSIIVYISPLRRNCHTLLVLCSHRAVVLKDLVSRTEEENYVFSFFMIILIIILSNQHGQTINDDDDY